MTATCPVCLCEQAEGLLCHDDTTRLERELGDVAAIVGELDVTLSKQARIGAGSGTAGLARERMPISLGAMQAADNLGNVLTTWARDVCGDHLPFQPRHYAQPSIPSARILLDRVGLIRRHPAVAELVDEITDAIHQARRAVDRPADKVYLGQCLVETPDDEGRQVTCLEEIYAHASAKEVTCKVCGTEHPVGERRAWMLERAQETIVSVKEASFILGEAGGITISQASIRSYIHRQKLAYRAPVEAKRFRLGDLLTVVLDESERRSA